MLTAKQSKTLWFFKFLLLYKALDSPLVWSRHTRHYYSTRFIIFQFAAQGHYSEHIVVQPNVPISFSFWRFWICLIFVHTPFNVRIDPLNLLLIKFKGFRYNIMEPPNVKIKIIDLSERKDLWMITIYHTIH